MRSSESQMQFPIGKGVQRLALSLLLIGPCVLIVAIVWLSVWRAPAVPVWDEWEMVGILWERDAGTLDLSDFWSFHHETEQRIAMSRAISLVIISLTDWNRLAHMGFNLVLTGVTAGMLVQTAYWTVASRMVAAAIAAPILALCFSLTRFANWFLPFTDKIPTIFAVTMCGWALSVPSGKPRWLLIAWIGALLASISSSGGLLVWLAFTPSLLLVGRKACGAWVGSAIVVFGLYLTNFQSGELDRVQARGESILPPFFDSLGFVLAYLGAPIAYPEPGWSQVFGLLGLVLLGSNLWFLRVTIWETRYQRRLVTIWAGLAGFALLSAGAVLVGRSVAFGQDSAITSRYIGLSSFLWLAVIVLAATAVHTIQKLPPGESGSGRTTGAALLIVNGAGLLLALAFFIQASLVSFRHASGYLAQLQANQHCVLAFDRAPNECLSLYHWSQLRPELVSYLATSELASFRDLQHISTTVPVPDLANGDSGRLRCSRIGTATIRDPISWLPESIPDQVLLDLCDRARGSGGETTTGPNGEGRPFYGACAVDNWGVFGERLLVEDQPWCLVSWYGDGKLMAVTLLNNDGSLVMHAFEADSVMLIENGREIKPRGRT
jgi:hypothetical protein